MKSGQVKRIKVEDGTRKEFVKRTPTVNETWNALIKEYTKHAEDCQRNPSVSDIAYHDGYLSGLYVAISLLSHVVFGKQVLLPTEPWDDPTPIPPILKLTKRERKKIKERKKQ